MNLHIGSRVTLTARLLAGFPTGWIFARGGVVAVAVLMLAPAAIALPASIFGSSMVERRYPVEARSGKEIYRTICQGCHMPDGNGAAGAGRYPNLASNPHLETAAYPISVVLHGQKAMPPFAGFLSDSQVGEVVNYIRSNLKNHYRDKVTELDVKALR
jgi:mono/diheme cytochrome c family protein